MGVHFSVEDIDFSLKQKLRVKKWIEEVVKREGKKVGDVCYLFCSDAHLLEVNISYLNHDTYTDIITFDYVEGNKISGDILISVDRVTENAKAFDTTFEKELHRVIIHGVLHLLGNADKSDKESAKMRKLEDQALHLWDEMGE